ncbi:amino acid adenylation domain-containing protein [Streptomyces sp. ISL-11]|uniref:amino acid adenylation domain-containing protein n=1 Tax=Streptomyces sp. ISL-11 TaxID=2819174 RepID=UPI001BEC0958|nr:amino acid adenylation domain-containing protein [Streptomyces sp. ISL-11]MBT2382948.1 amino acid adenylation domain-containing protein [Streptomyces sp. ISL-11]
MTHPPAVPALLHHLFDAQAARVPDRTALRDEHGSLTYAETARRAGRLAARLHALLPAGAGRVGLHLRRGTDTVVAMLAVLKSGHAYVPLDPAYPAERLEFMAGDAALSLVVSDRELPAGLAGLPVVRLDEPDPVDLPDPAPATGTDPAAPAYVIYTSGSTGRPKGVQVPHRNVLALVRACDSRYALGADDVWTMFHSASFDFSVWEVWGALAHGATLVVVPEEAARSPRETLDLLVRERVTVFNVVPSVFRHLVRAVRPGTTPAPALRYVIFGGESIDVADVRAWRRAFGTDTRFVNTYGITEATVLVTSRPLTDAELDGDPSTDAASGFALDLGEPLEGWELRVLDEDGEPVRPGGTGEIHVAGSGVALGYLGRPDLTAERFVERSVASGPPRRYYRSGDLARLLPGGVLCYAGRADDQVKINGFRIELGEVEAALRGLPGVRDLVVVKTVSRVGEPMMTACWTAAEGVDPDEAAARLRAAALARLPRHLVPGRFVRLPELPLGPSGKTDRRALALQLTAAPTRRTSPVAS